MLEHVPHAFRLEPRLPEPQRRASLLMGLGGGHGRPIEARVKRECTELYPGVEPGVWYKVVLDGEFRDDLEGFWIQVNDWVTYVLSKHFDVQARPDLH